MMRFATLLFLNLLTLRVATATVHEATRKLAGHGLAPAYRYAGATSRAGALPTPPALSQTPVPGLSVYPNPAHGQTTVQVVGPGGADYKLRLNNVLGSEVRRLLVRPDNQPASGFAIDLSDLPPGLYFCSLLVNDKALVTKRLTIL